MRIFRHIALDLFKGGGCVMKELVSPDLLKGHQFSRKRRSHGFGQIFCMIFFYSEIQK